MPIRELTALRFRLAAQMYPSQQIPAIPDEVIPTLAQLKTGVPKIVRWNMHETLSRQVHYENELYAPIDTYLSTIFPPSRGFTAGPQRLIRPAIQNSKRAPLNGSKNSRNGSSGSDPDNNTPDNDLGLDNDNPGYDDTPADPDNIPSNNGDSDDSNHIPDNHNNPNDGVPNYDANGDPDRDSSDSDGHLLSDIDETLSNFSFSSTGGIHLGRGSGKCHFSPWN